MEMDRYNLTRMGIWDGVTDVYPPEEIRLPDFRWWEIRQGDELIESFAEEIDAEEALQGLKEQAIQKAIETQYGVVLPTDSLKHLHEVIHHHTLMAKIISR